MLQSILSFLLLPLALALPSYKVWRVGSEDDKVVASTQPGVSLIGGGTDPVEAFSWQIRNANGGDFVVLRASGTDAYNEWIYDMSKIEGNALNSVTTILFYNEKASAEPEVLDLIRNAEAIFFAGGDQSLYIKYWVGTQVQSIIQDKVPFVTVGGTSAGLAILGNWIYTAATGSAYSEESMLFPFNKYITLAPAFLKIPYLSTILTDTHFKTRDRMGRMLTFVAREIASGEGGAVAAGGIRGLGIDEHTALLLNITTGFVRVIGASTAYLCSPPVAPAVCAEGQHLTFENIECVRLEGRKNDTYSFASFTGDGVHYVNSIADGRYTNPWSTIYGPQEDADLTSSLSSSALKRAYLEAEYVIFHDKEQIRLSLNQKSAWLEEQFSSASASTAAFITAYNPQSVKKSAQENSAAQLNLRNHIEGKFQHVFRGEGRESKQGVGAERFDAWSAEESLLVLGINEEEARSLAAKFGQKAILFAERDATPRLLFV